MRRGVGLFAATGAFQRTGSAGFNRTLSTIDSGIMLRGWDRIRQKRVDVSELDGNTPIEAEQVDSKSIVENPYARSADSFQEPPKGSPGWL